MHKLEWPCRILLILHCLCASSGYIAFLQTHDQLVSPLIPSSLVLEIAKHSIYAGLPAALLLVFSIGFYFFQKRTIVIILSSLAIASWYILYYTEWI